MPTDEDRARISQLVFGHMPSQVVATAANLGLADPIGDEPRTGQELADRTETDPLATAHPGLRAILFDTAPGLAESGDVLGEAGVADRCATESGDFFTAVPPGADLYLIKSVLHDWDDDGCATILRHVRRVIPEHGRLLIVEPVLPDLVDGSTRPGMYLSDLNMLVNVGGRERTTADFEQGLPVRRFHSHRGATAVPAQRLLHHRSHLHPGDLTDARPAREPAPPGEVG